MIKAFTEPELERFRQECNFVDSEIEVFEKRSKGVPLERIAEDLHITLDGVKKISRKVNTKIRTIQTLH